MQVTIESLEADVSHVEGNFPMEEYSSIININEMSQYCSDGADILFSQYKGYISFSKMVLILMSALCIINEMCQYCSDGADILFSQYKRYISFSKMVLILMSALCIINEIVSILLRWG